MKMRRCEDEKMRRWADVKMRRCERRCEDEKMRYRPPLLEEPCAQTLSGKSVVIFNIVAHDYILQGAIIRSVKVSKIYQKCLNYTAETFCHQCQPECWTSDSGWTVFRQMWQLVSRRTSSFAECCAVNILENLETWSQIALWVVALLEQWVLYGLTPEKSQEVAFRLDAVHAKRTFLNIAKFFCDNRLSSEKTLFSSCP